MKISASQAQQDRRRRSCYLADALKNNTSLRALDLRGNDMSTKGRLSLLMLLNDVSTINATLHSNHTLTKIMWDDVDRSDLIFEFFIANENRGRDMDVEKVTSLGNDFATDKMIKYALKINATHNIITFDDDEGITDILYIQCRSRSCRQREID